MQRLWLKTLVILLLAGMPWSDGHAQKRSDRGREGAATVGPKRTDRTIPESERVKAIAKTEFTRVIVRPNKGYLSVVAVTGAVVTLTAAAPAAKKAAPIREVIKDEDGSLNLINLLPGSYGIEIRHEDYLPFTGSVQVDPAKPDTFVAINKMIAKYGGIRIGGAPAGAKVYLDEVLVKPASLVNENQSLVMNKIPTGKHRLRISREGMVDFDREVNVPPGEQALVAAQMELAQVSLTLISAPGARVYIGSEERAILPQDGKLTLKLLPGLNSIRILKDGYLEWKKDAVLALSSPVVEERATLIPIPSSAEGDWDPSLGPRKWHPSVTGWKFDNSGALIRGDKPVLFDTESNRDFNVYRDFRLEFDTVLSNGRGIAWIVRARDPQNYYLFQISGPRGGRPTFNFYICRNGQLEWKDSRPIVEKIDKAGDSFHIVFEARGDRFEARMTIASAPTASPHLIGIFQDDLFSYGGIGFRGHELSESLLQSFFVIPIK